MRARGVLKQLAITALASAAMAVVALDAAAGSASAPFLVTVNITGTTTGATGASGASGCRGAGDPVTLACSSSGIPAATVLQPRPELTGMTLADGWLTYGTRTEAVDSVYAASLTTRVIRYEQWEYVETLVSW